MGFFRKGSWGTEVSRVSNCCFAVLCVLNCLLEEKLENDDAIHHDFDIKVRYFSFQF